MLPSSPAEHDLADRLTLEAANNGEALISAVRAVFCGLVLMRFLALEPATGLGGSQVLLEVPLLAAATVGSAIALHAARRRRFRTLGLVVSSITDGVVCFVSLLSNVLWPDEGYTGLLRMPDAGAMLPTVFVSALRITPAATIAGVLTSIGSLAALVCIDQAMNGPRLSYGAPEITMAALLLVSVGAATWAAARGARERVRRAGHDSVRLGRARRHLDALLREHHDVRTLLSTARINLQLAQRESTSPCERLAAVGSALEELSSFVEGVKGQAFAELAAIDGRAPCDVDRAVHVAANVIRHRFPSVRLDIAVAHVRVEMVGGDRSLSQVIFNLLGNACEGDGYRSASCVRLEARASGRGLILHVLDDGPGFLPEALTSPAQAIPSTKPRGGGFGLMLVASLVESSGGRMELANRPGGGACVTLHLTIA